MDQQPIDNAIANTSDMKTVESALKALWEKSKRAADLITQLREEKHSLEAQLAAVQSEVDRLTVTVSGKDERIKELEAAGTLSEGRDTVFSNGELEVLTTKVKELLARIDAYL